MIFGPNHGVEATRQNLHRLDLNEDRAFAYDRLFGEPGKIYPSSPNPVEGTLLKLIDIVEQLDERVARLEGSGPTGPTGPGPTGSTGVTGPPATLAARTYNISGSGDARFCVDGLPRNAAGDPYEPSNPSITYDVDGRSKGPGRDPNRIVPGIKGSDMMDGKGPCDPYEWQGRNFPPWPPESYLP